LVVLAFRSGRGIVIETCPFTAGEMLMIRRGFSDATVVADREIATSTWSLTAGEKLCA
jgi:hypothetical protein